MLDSTEKIKHKYVEQYRMPVAMYTPANLSSRQWIPPLHPHADIVYSHALVTIILHIVTCLYFSVSI
jgi:hypothetical protein